MQVIQSKFDALSFNFSSDRSIYLQLAEKLELLIVNGSFGKGKKLPSIRELSLYEKVNPNTLQKALSLLEEEGLIRTDRTTGKFVTSDLEKIEQKRKTLAKKTIDSFLLEMEQIGFKRSEALNLINKGFSNEENF